MVLSEFMIIDRVYKTLPNGVYIPDNKIITNSNFEFTVAVLNHNHYCTGPICENFHSAHVQHHFECVANPHDNFIICFRRVPDWQVLSDSDSELAAGEVDL